MAACGGGPAPAVAVDPTECAVHDPAELHALAGLRCGEAADGPFGSTRWVLHARLDRDVAGRDRRPLVARRGGGGRAGARGGGVSRGGRAAATGTFGAGLSPAASTTVAPMADPASAAASAIRDAFIAASATSRGPAPSRCPAARSGSPRSPSGPAGEAVQGRRWRAGPRQTRPARRR